MKISTTTLLISISSASAFSAGYLNQLGGGATAPSGTGTPSYFDGMQAAPAVPAALAAPAAPAPSAADYLSALNGSGHARSVTGAGLTSYLNTMAPNGSAPRSGAGIGSYLDTVSPNASSSTVPPPGVPVPTTPAAATSAPLANSAPATGDYLSALNTETRSSSGAGITTYLNALPPGVRAAGGPGLTGYLEAFPPSARVAGGGPGLTTYLDAITTDDGAGGSFLERVHAQIMSLPDDGNRQVSGNTVTYASAEGSYAMSFIKKSESW